MQPSRSTLAPSATYGEILRIGRQRPLVCVSILARSRREVLRSLRRASKLGSDLAEFGIDALQSLNKEVVSEIISASPLPLIVTNRNKLNKGYFPAEKERLRLSFLLSSIESKPAFVDIEIDTKEPERSQLIRTAKSQGVGVIASYHDFETTPNTNRLLEIYKEASHTKADLVKLVFTPRSNKDVLSILQAAEFLGSDKTPYTIFGMGEHGKITRVLSPLLGSCLTYCSLNEPTSNFGQLSVTDVKSVFDVLGSKRGWKSIRKDHKEVMDSIIRELLSKEDYGLLYNPAKLFGI